MNKRVLMPKARFYLFQISQDGETWKQVGGRIIGLRKAMRHARGVLKRVLGSNHARVMRHDSPSHPGELVAAWTINERGHIAYADDPGPVLSARREWHRAKYRERKAREGGQSADVEEAAREEP